MVGIFREVFMTWHRRFLGVALLSALIVASNWPRGQVAAQKDELVQRGAYLVNEVARCGDCHTPRDNRGRLDFTRHLQGASMWFTPKVKPKEWENRAPDITARGKAGKWNEARMIKFLSTGQESDPPMPRYKLSVADAKAVTAYLRSLPGKKGGPGKKKDDD
jgi:mono/diheme cytochrome c family protein